MTKIGYCHKCKHPKHLSHGDICGWCKCAPKSAEPTTLGWPWDPSITAVLPTPPTKNWPKKFDTLFIKGYGCPACAWHYTVTSNCNPCILPLNSLYGGKKSVNPFCQYTSSYLAAMSKTPETEAAFQEKKKALYASISYQPPTTHPSADQYPSPEQRVGQRLGLNLRIDLPSACASFYALEHLYSQLWPPTSWETEMDGDRVTAIRPSGRDLPLGHDGFGSDTKQELRAYAVQHWLTSLETRMAYQFSRYLNIACGGELRYVNRKSVGQEHSPKITRYLVAIKHISSEERTDSWNHWNKLSKRNPAVWLEAAASAFLNRQWGKGYGGELWGTAASIGAAYLRGEMSARAFVDRCWSMQHHGGCLFNKFWYINPVVYPPSHPLHGQPITHPDSGTTERQLTRIDLVLELQASNNYDELVKWAEPGVQDLWGGGLGITWTSQPSRIGGSAT